MSDSCSKNIELIKYICQRCVSSRAILRILLLLNLFKFTYITPDGRLFTPSMMSDIHVKCRVPYEYAYRDAKGQVKKIKRHDVPAGQISWDVPFEFYDPISFDALHLATAPYADPDIKNPEFNPKFNQLDGKIDRRSHEGNYKVIQKIPLNVRGRTGLTGRGVLGRYGPNHAADPIVTRWKKHPEGGIVHDNVSSRPVLQFVSIQRRDTSEWALPGGMVDPGEHVSVTLRREFMEEALDSGTLGSKDKDTIEKQLKTFFDNGKEIYKGYVDDPRNTDNAWMETVAYLFHDDTGKQIGQFQLKAGDDAKALQWMDIDESLNLYTSHKMFLMLAAKRIGAHWRKAKPELNP